MNTLCIEKSFELESKRSSSQKTTNHNPQKQKLQQNRWMNKKKAKIRPKNDHNNYLKKVMKIKPGSFLTTPF